MAEAILVSSVGFLAVAIMLRVSKDSSQIRKKSRIEEKTTIVKYTFER